MNLIYIASLDFYTKPNPSFHLMTTMLEDVLSAGHSVSLIGCAENGVDKHIPDELEKFDTFKYSLIDVPNVKKSAFVKRYIEGIKYSWKVKKELKKIIDDGDVIFVQSSPTVLYTLLFAKKQAKNKKIIYNVQDMFPGSSIASGVMNQKWMQKVFFMLQKIAYKNADVITAISDDMKDKLVEQGVPENKIKVIVNWFDDKSVHPVKWDENRFVKKYNMSKDKFYIQYAGTMGYVFDYKMVIEVARCLTHNEKIVFQMIGEGSQKQTFMDEAKSLELDNIQFLPLESQDMVSDVYSACSVCFIPLKKGVIGNSVPSKAGLLMACKKAIVTSADKGSKYCAMINDNLIGKAVSSDNFDDAINALTYFYNNREKCIEYGENGYNYGHDLYSRDKNMKEYLSLFENCCE